MSDPYDVGSSDPPASRTRARSEDDMDGTGASAPNPPLDIEDTEQALVEIEEVLKRHPDILRLQRSVAYHYSGPLPHPEVLRQFNDAVQGSGNLIVEQWQEQGQHRMRLEATVVRGDNVRAYLGIAAGFIVAVIGLIVAWDLGRNGNEIAAGILGGGTLGSLAAVFVYGTVTRRSERQQKSDRALQLRESEE